MNNIDLTSQEVFFIPKFTFIIIQLGCTAQSIYNVHNSVKKNNNNINKAKIFINYYDRIINN